MWNIRSLENKDYGKEELCGKLGVWKMRSMANEESGR